MATAKDIQALIKEKGVTYVDVRFTDVRGKLQHVTFDLDLVDDEFLTDGTMFDGSSIAGWKAINESDMKLRPDLDSAYIDPFYQETTLVLHCDVVNPDDGTPYRTTPAIATIATNCRSTATRTIRKAIWATARAPRAAISRSTRSTACRTCAAKCSRSWASWA
jgi:glutamine synthetase